jgi:hypothetical protein
MRMLLKAPLCTTVASRCCETLACCTQPSEPLHQHVTRACLTAYQAGTSPQLASSLLAWGKYNKTPLPGSGRAHPLPCSRAFASTTPHPLKHVCTNTTTAYATAHPSARMRACRPTVRIPYHIIKMLQGFLHLGVQDIRLPVGQHTQAAPTGKQGMTPG